MRATVFALRLSLLATLFFLPLPCLLEAKVIGADERPQHVVTDCRKIPFTIARVVVPDGTGNFSRSTASVVRLRDGEAFFVTAAHVFYKNGVLRADLSEITVEIMVQRGRDCVFKAARVDRFATGSTKPRRSFHAAAHDILIFQVAGWGAGARGLTPLEYKPANTAKFHAVEIIAFSADVAGGQRPFRQKCRLRRRPAESEYDETRFLHHDCDTSGGASGSPLLRQSHSGAYTPVAVHTVGWGIDGEQFGEGVYNVAAPLDFEMLSTLYRAMKRYGD